MASVLPLFLPRISFPGSDSWCCSSQNPDTYLNHCRRDHSLSLQHLGWAIQNKADPKSVKSYLEAFHKHNVKTELSGGLATTSDAFFPVLYLAIERNSPEIVRILCTFGADPSQKMRFLGFSPLRVSSLVYAVITAEYDLSDTTDTVISLLAMGAEPADVPQDMWERYAKTPCKDTPKDKLKKRKEGKDLWCTSELREALSRNLNLMQRYVLWKASTLSRKTTRLKQVALKLEVGPLLEVPYHIIGQRRATDQVIQLFMDHLMFGDKAPLVCLFTGPSGHGKTELARQMGDLLSLEMVTVDCTEMKHESDLFGPKKPYQGWENGSSLNNFLADNAGQKCIVFLDELDKTSTEVRNAMLLPVESGLYKDRRDKTAIDCSKVSWILAANVGSESIQKFWTETLKELSEEQQAKVSFTIFENGLRQHVVNKFGAPFTGRLSAIIPFMPFTRGEQAVATYKFMRNLWSNVRQPIDVVNKHFPRHLFVNYIDDGSVAAHIANEAYSAETGARPLMRAVNNDIRRKLAGEFLDVEEMVGENMNDEPMPNYEVRLMTLADGVTDISVTVEGTKTCLRPESSSND